MYQNAKQTISIFWLSKYRLVPSINSMHYSCMSSRNSPNEINCYLKFAQLNGFYYNSVEESIPKQRLDSEVESGGS